MVNHFYDLDDVWGDNLWHDADDNSSSCSFFDAAENNNNGNSNKNNKNHHNHLKNFLHLGGGKRNSKNSNNEKDGKNNDDSNSDGGDSIMDIEQLTPSSLSLKRASYSSSLSLKRASYTSSLSLKRASYTSQQTPSVSINASRRPSLLRGIDRKESMANMIPVKGCFVQGDIYRDKFVNVCKLDKKRSKLINDVEEPNTMKVLLHWTGTIWMEIIFDVVFWLTIFLYVALRVWISMIRNKHYNNDGDEINDINNNDAEYYDDTYYDEPMDHHHIDDTNSNVNDVDVDPTTTMIRMIEDSSKVFESLPIIGGFLTLFLVFFVDQNHERYFHLHDSTMHIMGRICNLSQMLAASTKLPIERSRRINRYCNAAQVVMYAGLTSYFQDGYLVHNFCRDYRLLTYEETQRLEDCGLYNGKASACFELLAWALQDVNRALRAKMLDGYQALEMRQHIIEFRTKINEILVLCLCPMPFAYVHFLSLLTAIYLPLFALMVALKTGIPSKASSTQAEQLYAGSWYLYATEITGLLLVFLQSIFLIGLRILGQQLGTFSCFCFIKIIMSSSTLGEVARR